MQEAFKTLKQHKNRLTKQQYRTFKGQILAGDIEGFYKGITKMLQIVKRY